MDKDTEQGIKSAIEANDISRIGTLLDEWQQKAHLPSSQPMFPFQSCLHEAARQSQPDAIDILLSRGCQIDTSTVVAATGKVPVFEVLIKHGFDINLCLGHVGDALIAASLAIASDNTTFVSYLLDHGADTNSNTRNELYTPLECAAISASIPTIQLLLSHGAKLSTRRTLCIAATYGRTDMVQFLLENGAAIDEIPDNEDIYESELEQGVGTALHAAVEAGKLETARLLLDRGASVDVRDSNGRTALELAQLKGQTACVDLLEGIQ